MGYGDELMVSGRARVMQQTDPRKVLVTYQGAPKWSRWASVWENNPRIAKAGERGDFQELQARDRVTNMRPYHLAKTPERWTYNPAFRADVGEIYFTEEEKAFGRPHVGAVILEPHIKPGASPNKDWGWARWNELALLVQQAGLRVMQVGAAGTPVLNGAELIVTPSFRLACAVLFQARAAILPEGGLHHAAAALGVPAVVIFGGFTPVELTGYALHRNLGVSVGEACGRRTPCAHCAVEMGKIAPARVMLELEGIIEKLPRSLAA
jgi:ADP-heptose:LPS heptosyltransferase